jgi:hypothetical protein
MVDQSDRFFQSHSDEWHNRCLGYLEGLCFRMGCSPGYCSSRWCGEGIYSTTKHRRNASEFVSELESVIIDARFEWHSIFSGQYSARDIMERWRTLAKVLNETETKHFPDGLPVNSSRQKLAEDDAKAYFLTMYGVGEQNND